MNIITRSFLFASILTTYGCLGGGTHGSIKTYEYQVSKATLEKAIWKVINLSVNIQRDTSKNYYNDSMNYYNDSVMYITIKIRKGEIENDYTFRYGGGKEYWDTAIKSSIFIAYAFDKQGNGGSEGNGGIRWYKPVLKKKLISVFESEFVSKVDKVLGVNHTEPD